jgi:purine nucleosidase
MKYSFDVPEQKKMRVIINTDVMNEADDQFALVHALLTPRFKVKGVIAAHFGDIRSKTSMEDSYAEAKRILSLMGMEGSVDVFKGAVRAIKDESTPEVSEGAELIIREALADDPSPVYAIFLGPLTDLASAYLMEPKIAERLNVIWIGGREWPNGGEEYNLSNDITAANVVFKSNISLWQVPKNVYSSIKVSIAELEYKVKPCGEIGEYLFDQLIGVNEKFADNARWPLGECWSLGDSPAVGLLLDPHEFCYELKPAPLVAEDMHYIHGYNNRLIRVYNHVDSRFILEDMFSKLALNYLKR